MTEPANDEKVINLNKIGFEAIEEANPVLLSELVKTLKIGAPVSVIVKTFREHGESPVYLIAFEQACYHIQSELNAGRDVVVQVPPEA